MSEEAGPSRHGGDDERDITDLAMLDSDAEGEDEVWAGEVGEERHVLSQPDDIDLKLGTGEAAPTHRPARSINGVREEYQLSTKVLGKRKSPTPASASSSRHTTAHVHTLGPICPICSKALGAGTSNQGLNEHIDWCLNQDAIEAVDKPKKIRDKMRSDSGKDRDKKKGVGGRREEENGDDDDADEVVEVARDGTGLSKNVRGEETVKVEVQVEREARGQVKRKFEKREGGVMQWLKKADMRDMQ
jgi:hypothetical protein